MIDRAHKTAPIRKSKSNMLIATNTDAGVGSWPVALLAAAAVAGGLAWCQTIGYYRARRFDESGKTDIYHRGWPLVYSEHFQPAASRREAMAPQWFSRLTLDLLCSAIGTAAVAFTAARLVSSRLRFRLGTLLLVTAVAGGLCILMPIERQLLAPQADWGFTWSQPQTHWRTNLYWNWPITLSTILASACTLHAAGYFAARAFWALSRFASRMRRR